MPCDSLERVRRCRARKAGLLPAFPVCACGTRTQRGGTLCSLCWRKTPEGMEAANEKRRARRLAQRAARAGIKPPAAKTAKPAAKSRPRLETATALQEGGILAAIQSGTTAKSAKKKAAEKTTKPAAKRKRKPSAKPIDIAPDG